MANIFCCVLLKNGKSLFLDFTTSTEEGLPITVGDACEIEEEIIDFSYDRTTLEPLYVVVKDESDEKSVKAIYKQGEVHDIKIQG